MYFFNSFNYKKRQLFVCKGTWINIFLIKSHYTYPLLGGKYTGIWDGNKGQGEISYKDGTKYKGQWDGDYAWKLKRHGVGTLYSEDGQLLIQGKWDKDKYKGKE